MGSTRSLGLGRYHTDERDLVITSTTYGGGGPVVIVAHGFGADATFYAEPERYHDLDVLAQLGCVVVVCDLGGSNTWANDDFLARLADALTYAETEFDADRTRTGLIGDSMGGMGVLNYHWRNPEDIKATIVRLPIVCADRVHDRDAGLGAAMDGAYDDDWDGNKAERDPLANAAEISPFRDNVRLYYSTNDPYIPLADVTDFMTAAGMVPTQARSLGAVEHDPGLVYPRIPARRQADWLLRRLNA